MATMSTLPGIKGNSQQCFSDALERSKLENPAIALWINEEGRVCWEASCTNIEALWMLQKQLTRILIETID